MPRLTSILAASLASLMLVSFSLPAMAEGRGESASSGGSHGSADSQGSQQSHDTSSLFDPEDCTRDLVSCQTWRKELSKANNRTDRIIRAAQMSKQDALVRDAIAQYARDGNDEAIEALQVLGLLGPSWTVPTAVTSARRAC